jgi:tetratricopeptide (TPR) repeat protein
VNGLIRYAACIAAVLLLVGCPSMAADHERLGDRAYVAANYGDALTEYRLALLQAQGPNARLHAKAAAAALHVGELKGAADEYLALARADGARTAEAADGLARVAQAATRGSDRAALRTALTGLRELAEGPLPSGFAVQLAEQLDHGAPPADILVVLPLAAAAAPDARLEDSLMFAYATVLARVGRCAPAVAVFEGIVRRQRVPSVVAGAAQGAGACALRLGRAALDGGRAGQAEEWFRRAVSQADDSPIGRAAYIGLGDVMAQRGDLVGAAEAYQRVLLGATPGDSVAALARDRLNRIANAGTVFP